MPIDKSSFLMRLISGVLIGTRGIRLFLVLTALLTFFSALITQITIKAIAAIISMLQQSVSLKAINTDWVTGAIIGIAGETPLRIVFVYGSLVIIGAIIAFIARYSTASVDYAMNALLRQNVYKALLHPSNIRKFNTTESVGDRVAVLDRLTLGAQPMLRELFCFPITRIFPLITALYFLFVSLSSAKSPTDQTESSIVLYLIITIGLIGSPLAALWMGGKLRTSNDKVQEIRGQLTNEAVFAATHTETLVAAGTWTVLKEKFRQLNLRVTKVSRLMRLKQEIASQLQSLVVPLVQFGLIAYALLASGDNAPNLGMVMAIYLFVPQVMQPVQSLVNFGTAVAQATPIIDRVTDLLLETPNEMPGDLSVGKVDASCELIVKEFKIPVDDRKPTILDVRELILSGPGLVTIVGTSGSGKSLLLKTLARLTEYTNEKIYINGLDLNRIKENELRKTISFAEQFPLTVDGTIEENIRISNPDITAHGISSIIEQFDAGKLLSESGSSTEEIFSRTVQDNGKTLFSGGERRILSICRAAAGGQPVLLLDEPTTGLDPASVNNLARSLIEAKRDRFILLVDHNAKFVKAVSDRVIQLDKGSVVYDGSPTNFRFDKMVSVERFTQEKFPSNLKKGKVKNKLGSQI